MSRIVFAPGMRPEGLAYGQVGGRSALVFADDNGGFYVSWEDESKRAGTFPTVGEVALGFGIVPAGALASPVALSFGTALGSPSLENAGACAALRWVHGTLGQA
jgi:hypothetical protein